MKVKLNDKVLVISGKDRGKTGKVVRVDKDKEKVVVEKANMRTKHVKKTASQAGQIIHFEAPMSIANVIVICPSCEKPTRVGYQVLKTGEKHRVCKKCKQTLDLKIEKAKAKK